MNDLVTSVLFPVLVSYIFCLLCLIFSVLFLIVVVIGKLFTCVTVLSKYRHIQLFDVSKPYLIALRPICLPVLRA